MSTQLPAVIDERPGFAPARFTVQDLDTIAERVVASRLFPGIDTKQAAFTLMLICQSEGLHPAQAMKRYHVINGRPSMKADAMLAEFQSHGGTVEWIARTDTEVTAAFSHPTQARKPVTITWDMKRANLAGVTGNPTWKKYPRQMLTARVISEGVRLVLPGVVAGIYTPEEVQDFEPARNAEPEPRRRHDATPPARESRLVDGGSPALDKQFSEWIGAFLDERNQQWIAHWDRIEGVSSPADLPDLMNEFQLKGHLHKWLDHPAGKGPVNNHIHRALAVAWRDRPGDFEAEATRYCREVWRERKAEVEKRNGNPAVVEAELVEEDGPLPEEIEQAQEA